MFKHPSIETAKYCESNFLSFQCYCPARKNVSRVVTDGQKIDIDLRMPALRNHDTFECLNADNFKTKR